MRTPGVLNPLPINLSEHRTNVGAVEPQRGCEGITWVHLPNRSTCVSTAPMRNILFELGFSLHPWFTPIRTSPSSTAGSQGNGVYCNCGQVMSTFSPETAKVYLVEFQFKG